MRRFYSLNLRFLFQTNIMSTQALQQINVLLFRFEYIPEQLPDWPGWIDECKSNNPLRALREVRRLVSSPLPGPTQLVVHSGLVPVLFGLMQQNPHDFSMLFSGYVRRMNFPYIIPVGIVQCIAKKAEIFTVDERIQVECRWILCNIAAGINFEEEQ